MPQIEERNPSIAEIIEFAIERGLAETRVSMPGTIVDYDASTEFCSVQPGILDSVLGSAPEKLPIIEDVKVLHPSCRMGNAGGYAIIHLPVKKDTPGLLIFGDMSFDSWINNPVPGSTPVGPFDLRRHDLSDAVFIPGFNPKNKTIAPPIIPTFENDIRISLFYPEQNIDSQFWLGGDTGDIVAIPSPQGAVRLGARTAAGYAAETTPKVVLDLLLQNGIPVLSTALSGAIVTALGAATPPVVVAQPALDAAINAAFTAFFANVGTERVRGAI